MAAEQTGLVTLVGVIAAAAGAAGGKLLDVWLSTHREKGEVQKRRDDFVTTLLMQERDRYEKHLEEYKAADREERHSLRNRVTALDAEVQLLRRKLEEAWEAHSVRVEQIEGLKAEIQMLRTWQRKEP